MPLDLEVVERVRVLEPDNFVFDANDFVVPDDIAFSVNSIIDGGDPAAGLAPNCAKLPFADFRGRSANFGLAERPVQEEWIALADVDPVAQVRSDILAIDAGGQRGGFFFGGSGPSRTAVLRD